jgi:hypothetical protein
MTPAERADRDAWKALLERTARLPEATRDRVIERSCLLYFGGEAATWAEADEKALAMEAGVATQRKLVA